ncbi:unnamed protein product [Kuraishia capsulata CBS 1993]|uniref:Uncharacterized protein n=1 Tax=Kuraishia capsulata CBS 1993 TaxID=1382522 RepID=W6MJT7_9ASCO|nr:unnamed protein product [Kuraishia capsulata CBS 1993]
MVVDGTGTRIV